MNFPPAEWTLETGKIGRRKKANVFQVSFLFASGSYRQRSEIDNEDDDEGEHEKRTMVDLGDRSDKQAEKRQRLSIFDLSLHRCHSVAGLFGWVLSLRKRVLPSKIRDR
jgi:hypothetical protein